MHDEEKNGQPSDVLNEDTVSTMHTLILDDYNFTVLDIHLEMMTQYLPECIQTTI